MGSSGDGGGGGSSTGGNINIPGTREYNAAKAVVDKANQLGRQLTHNEATSSYNNAYNGGTNRNTNTNTNSDVSRMTPSQQSGYFSYDSLKSRLGRTPTAADIQQNNREYQQAISGRASNPNDNRIWNRYGEVIGQSPNGGYVDYSDQASNAVVNPNFIKTPSNNYNQRTLTATDGNEPSYVDYSKLPAQAENYIKNNPGTSWDRDSLVEAWKNKYKDISSIQTDAQSYIKEFGGIAPVLQATQQNQRNREQEQGQPQQVNIQSKVMVPQNNNNGYITNPNWIGNVHQGVQWHGDTRTITTADGKTLRENVDFFINPTDQRAYIMNPIQNQTITSNTTNTPVTPVTPPQPEQDAYQNLMNEFYDKFGQYMENISNESNNQQMPTLDEYISTLYSKMSPQLESQISELKQEKARSQDALTDDFIRRGFGWQGAHLVKADELNDIYTDSEAKTRSNFLSNVVGMAAPLYQNEINRITSSKNNYNQFMINLGLQLMNGAIDAAQFSSNQAYQQAVWAALLGENAIGATGINNS